MLRAVAAVDAFDPPLAIANVPEFTSLAAMLLFVKVCVPARLTSVSVAAGMLTVTVPSAPVTGSSVSKPDVALPIVTEPNVPDNPSCGVAVYAGAPDELVAFPKTVPAPALLSAKDKAGVEVAVATLVVNIGERFPELKLVTLPPVAADVEQLEPLEQLML